MKKVILITGIVCTLAGCNNNNENAANKQNPNKVHPVSETFPDSLKLVGDSTLVPDFTPGNGKAGTHDDSSRKHVHK